MRALVLELAEGALPRRAISAAIPPPAPSCARPPCSLGEDVAEREVLAQIPQPQLVDVRQPTSGVAVPAGGAVAVAVIMSLCVARARNWLLECQRPHDSILQLAAQRLLTPRCSRMAAPHSCTGPRCCPRTAQRHEQVERRVQLGEVARPLAATATATRRSEAMRRRREELGDRAGFPTLLTTC